VRKTPPISSKTI